MYTDYQPEMFLLNIPHEMQTCSAAAEVDVFAIQGTEKAWAEVSPLNPSSGSNQAANIPINAFKPNSHSGDPQ